MLAAASHSVLRRRSGLLLWRTSSSYSRGGPTPTTSSSKGGPTPTTSTLTLEVRAGTGGLEAAAFAADLFRMYRAYVATRPGWSWAEKAALPYAGGGGGGGGVRLAAARIAGPGAAAALAGEAGVHRVQRVPAAASSGRTQTSAATVAILGEGAGVSGAGVASPTAPQPSSSSRARTRPRDAAAVAATGGGGSAPPPPLDPSTIRIDTFRSSGAGGQHVNTTDSAVRAVHLPTGTAAVARGDRSQHKNRAAALGALAARLAGAAVGKAAATRASTRKAQVGSGDRSARVRTYNLVRGRVTDHRTGVVVADVSGVLSGRRLGELLVED